ncbi:kinesin-like protein KIN-7K, chloroplastic [Rhododendron vialii]|uniref:kinesin-like protein KIN-7K, chloroplastic n=1 Tax=Rhododendron vialii TaxID=182163 RepID=UPI00265FF331|nr:kinesin-like protein KIN-7K, chloroplastic [Rhododendron vialii]
MSSRHGSKPKKTSSRGANSPSTSTTSSSKHFQEPSVDGLCSPASTSKPQYFYSESLPADSERSKENVTVTVRFRPLSPREIRHGEEIAWYADGETIVRNEHNPTIAYAYDRVFGPTTTTRHVYDVAAQHVVSGAMEGINGTIFAYGVTSSGKTHTMHGDQRSPGIIPLAVKDAFSIIQETPSREFLLRVSYLEIYNEVVNDLLNPAGQNLRIREDAQGTFVEGIKEEVVLSPAHALSLIAAGEEHRHVGSTNFNLLSSRSHTIFTLTIESSPCGDNCEGGAVNLSQLNLIDLAGSESSKAETTGVRRKEGSYINKSLLTLGTVISKLTDGRATHVPYRDSKLTRLLQSSLSGHGRVSLICTVTPSSSSTEETHNTLKFAHRAKHIEIQAAQNKIIDEKSLIKKYQNEIRLLKEELEQLKRGIVTLPQLKDAGGDDIVILKQKLEDGQVKLQSRLEQEEEAKAALLGRIQRLTKLILVSTKTSQSSRFPNRPGTRRRHSFGEEELAYLPHRRKDLILDDENIDSYVSPDGNSETGDDTLKEEKKSRKHGLLNWFLRKRDSNLGSFASNSDRSSGVKSSSTTSTPQAESVNYQIEYRHSHSLLAESIPDPLSHARQDRECLDDSFLGQETPLTSIKTIDQIDLLREQQKILSGEVALHSSALKRLSEEAARNPKKEHILAEIRKLNDEIRRKNEQIALLEKQIDDSIISSNDKMDNGEASLALAELMEQLNEKSFELEVKTADNRVIQEQLNHKIQECEGLQETVASLKQQLSDALELTTIRPIVGHSQRSLEAISVQVEHSIDSSKVMLLQSQATEIEELKQRAAELTEAKEQLELRNQKLAEDSTYAKGLASAAAVELKALSEEVAKLMNHNDRLSAELAAQKNSPMQRRNSSTVRNGRRDVPPVRRQDQGSVPLEFKRELALSREREHSYEVALAEKDSREAELQRKVEESKQREAYLENELANMWVLVAKLKKSHGSENDVANFDDFEER